MNKCEACGRPAKQGQFLCYDCKQRDNDTQLGDIDRKTSREFKYGFREYQAEPIVARRLR